MEEASILYEHADFARSAGGVSGRRDRQWRSLVCWIASLKSVAIAFACTIAAHFRLLAVSRRSRRARVACYVDIRGIHEYAAKRPPSTPEPDGARYGEFPVELVAVVLAIAMTAFFYYTTMNCGDLLA